MRMRMPIILETFIGDLAKIEKRTISFDVSAVCFSLHGTIKISLDGFSLINPSATEDILTLTFSTDGGV